MDQNIIPDNNLQPMPKQSNQIPSWIGFVIIIFVVAILFGGVFAYQYFTTNNQPINQPAGFALSGVEGWKTYTNINSGISFKYPENITLVEKADSIELSHSVAFKNSGCDMRGDGVISERLNDFNLNLQVFSGNIKAAAKKFVGYIPEENFTADSLKPSPGFIDSVKIGDLSGFSIYQGVEGCGNIIDLMPLSNLKTLVLTRGLVQELSGVVGLDIKNALLAVPGVISSEKSDEIFKQILSTFKFTTPVDQTASQQLSDAAIIAALNKLNGFQLKKNAQGNYSADYLGGTYNVITIAKGDLNGDKLQDAVVQSSGCGASCGSIFTVVINKGGNLTDAFNVVPDGIITSGANQYSIESITINDPGIVSGIVAINVKIWQPVSNSTFIYILVGNNLVRH